MAYLNDDIRKQITELFAPLKKDVQIVLFTKETDCDSCEDTKGFVEEMAQLNDGLSLTLYDIDTNADKAKELTGLNNNAIRVNLSRARKKVRDELLRIENYGMQRGKTLTTPVF